MNPVRERAAAVAFKIWARIAEVDVSSASQAVVVEVSVPCASSLATDISDPIERLRLSLEGRECTVWVSTALERRLRAHLHRCNASLASTGEDEVCFDTHADVDLEAALLTAATEGIRAYEREDGVSYDEYTGLPIGLPAY